MDEQLVALRVDVGNARVVPFEVEVGGGHDPLEILERGCATDEEGSSTRTSRRGVSNAERSPSGRGTSPCIFVGSSGARGRGRGASACWAPATAPGRDGSGSDHSR